jgi:hypothetical protein
MTKPYSGPTVNGTRTEFPVTLSQSITASLRRLQGDLGGKTLAGHFDGRDGAEVAESTISRWISEPRRFPAIFLPALVEMDATFRGEVLRLLTASLATHEAVSARLSSKAATEYRAVVERLMVEEVKPGVWGRTR